MISVSVQYKHLYLDLDLNPKWVWLYLELYFYLINAAVMVSRSGFTNTCSLSMLCEFRLLPRINK